MTDQTRAAFESHFGLTTRQAWQHPDGSYKFPEIQAKWEGFQAGVAKAAPTSVLADCDIIAIANKHIEGWIANDKSVILECVTAAIREALRSAAAAPGAASNPLEGWDKAVAYVNQRWPAQTLAPGVDDAMNFVFARKEMTKDQLRALLAAAAPVAAPECCHTTTIKQRFGDGKTMEFCRDCGTSRMA